MRFTARGFGCYCCVFCATGLVCCCCCSAAFRYHCCVCGGDAEGQQDPGCRYHFRRFRLIQVSILSVEGNKEVDELIYTVRTSFDAPSIVNTYRVSYQESRRFSSLLRLLFSCLAIFVRVDNGERSLFAVEVKWYKQKRLSPKQPFRCSGKSLEEAFLQPEGKAKNKN